MTYTVTAIKHRAILHLYIKVVYIPGLCNTCSWSSASMIMMLSMYTMTAHCRTKVGINGYSQKQG